MIVGARGPSLIACSLSLWATACGSRTTLGETAGREPFVDAGGRLDAVDGARETSEPACESASISIDDLRPTVTLLIDQSGSMVFGYPSRSDDLTRWSLVRDALLDPDRGAIKSLQSRLRFGVAFFTSHNGASTGTCPIISEVRAATNNYEAIRTLYDRMSPDDDTPTGDAIEQTVQEIESSPTRGPQSILLVTDGDPDTCAQPDPQDGQDLAIAATQHAHRAGIDLYVLGISEDISGDKLQQLANAGKGAPVDLVGQDLGAQRYFQASGDTDDLTAQFLDILQRVPLCEVRLRRDVTPAEASGGRVVLDGRSLQYGEGFTLTDARRLQIVGDACNALTSNGKKLEVRISCEDSMR